MVRDQKRYTPSGQGLGGGGAEPGGNRDIYNSDNIKNKENKRRNTPGT